LETKVINRPKYGPSCVPGRLKPGRRTQRLKYGSPGKYGMVGSASLCSKQIIYYPDTKLSG